MRDARGAPHGTGSAMRSYSSCLRRNRSLLSLASVVSLVSLAAAAAIVNGCAADSPTNDGDGDSGSPTADSGTHDAPASDAGHHDSAAGDDAGQDGAGEIDASDGSIGADADAYAPTDAADAYMPDTSVPDTSVPDTSVPDTSVPDTSVPDTSVPDTSIPDTSIPDTSSGVDGCVPTALVCDGLVHACDGVVDKGCPNGMTFGSPTTESPAWGGTGGTAFSDTCPDGQVLVGLAGQVGGYIDRINGICGTVAVAKNTSSVPYTYSVTIGAGTTLPSHGIQSSTPHSAQCPADQAIVAIQGSSGNGVDAVQIWCAPLIVTGSPGAFTISQGVATAQPQWGGTGGGAFAKFSCPDPQVVRVLAGRSGNSVDRLSVVCQSPMLIVN
jgi:hypothetical protein